MRVLMTAVRCNMTEPQYRYQDPSGTYDLTRSEILAEYFPWWSAQMQRVGKADQISEDACLDDWIVTHWAWLVPSSSSSSSVSE